MLKWRQPMLRALIVSLILSFNQGIIIRAQEQTTAEQDLQKGRVMHLQGKYGEAIEVLKQALAKKSDLPEAHCYLGMSYYRMGQYEVAEASLREALKQKNDTYPDAHFWLGMVYFRKQSFDQAVREFRTAIEQRNGTYPDALNVLGVIYYSQKNYAEAVKSLRESLEQNPDSPQTNFNYGMAVEKELIEGQGDSGLSLSWSDAIDAYRAAIKSQATYFQGHKALGLALIGSDNAAATAELETFLQQSPPQSTERVQVEEILDLLKKPDDPAMQIEEFAKVRGIGKHPAARPTEDAIRNKIQGSVVLLALFCYDRQVRVVKVMKGLGHGLDESAVEAVKRSQFEPTTQAGRRVSERHVIKIDFKT